MKKELKFWLGGKAFAVAGLLGSGQVAEWDAQNPQEEPIAGLWKVMNAAFLVYSGKKLYEATHPDEKAEKQQDSKTFDATAMFLNKKQLTK